MSGNSSFMKLYYSEWALMRDYEGVDDRVIAVIARLGRVRAGRIRDTNNPQSRSDAD